MVLKNFGMVRGLAVWSRSIVGSFFAGIQSLFGGDIRLYLELCEQVAAMPSTRPAEVLCCGTAVRVSESAV